MSKVVLFGCGRGADIAHRYLTTDSDHQVAGFTVDERYHKQTSFKGLPLVPFEQVERHFPPDQYKMLVLLGSQQMNHLRAHKYLAAKSKGYSFVNYVSSRAYSLEPLVVGENCFILDGQCINLDVSIGNNVVMWSCNQIGDKTVIGDHVWISSHATIAGDVIIEEYSFLGINVSVANHVTIEPETFIGAGAFIAQNTTRGGVYVSPETKCFSKDSLTFMKVMEAANKI
ncbi:MAG: acetyltransferase [Desulfobacteraceae bacterium]|nr:MAG: acetyltransferase [Desulfobacteraceae bacterium]